MAASIKILLRRNVCTKVKLTSLSISHLFWGFWESVAKINAKWKFRRLVHAKKLWSKKLPISLNGRKTTSFPHKDFYYLDFCSSTPVLFIGSRYLLRIIEGRHLIRKSWRHFHKAMSKIWCFLLCDKCKKCISSQSQLRIVCYELMVSFSKDNMECRLIFLIRVSSLIYHRIKGFWPPSDFVVALILDQSLHKVFSEESCYDLFFCLTANQTIIKSATSC